MWPNPQIAVHLVTFIDEILNEELHFLCSDLENEQPFSCTSTAQRRGKR